MNKVKNIGVVSLFLLSGAFALTFVAPATPVEAACTLSYQQAFGAWADGRLTLTMAKTSGSNVNIYVNNQTGCSIPLVAASYRVYGGSTPQSVIESEEQTIGPGQAYTFSMAIDSCLSQVDIWYPGGNGGGFLGKIYDPSGAVFGDIPSAYGTFCSGTPEEEEESNFHATCAVSASSVTVGQNVTFTAQGKQGSGNYTYSWTGGTGSKTGASFTESYSTAGEYEYQVTVTDGNESKKKKCSVTVTGTTNSGLAVSCSANPNSITTGNSMTWSATASGGTGSYTYSWTGSDSLSGTSQAISGTYTSAGSKSATVTVTDGAGQTGSATCSGTVDSTTSHSSILYASCSATPSTSYIGNTVTYSGNGSGGTGNYTYSWSGSDGLSGTGQSALITYTNSGSKYGYLTVRDSSGQSNTATCYAYVNEPTVTTNPNLSVSCSANPSSGVMTGQSVSWLAYPSGGNGYYTYTWSGSDSLYGSNQSIYTTYNTAGQKSATVTVYSNGQQASQTCYTSVGTVAASAARSQLLLASANSVYLDEIPYTGLLDDGGFALFILVLSLVAAYLSYLFIRNRESSMTALIESDLEVVQIPVLSNLSSPMQSIRQEFFERLTNAKIVVSEKLAQEVLQDSFLDTDQAMSVIVARAEAKRQNEATTGWVEVE